MAAGSIVTVLANIPWGQVLDTAPKIADGAAKLWGMITKRTEEDTVADRLAAAVDDSGVAELEALNDRIQALDAKNHSLQEQIQAASELLKGLAEQNALLVQRVELNRVRLIRCAAAFATTSGCLAIAIGYIAIAR